MQTTLAELLARKRELLTRVSGENVQDRSAPIINPAAKLMCVPLGSASSVCGSAYVDEIVSSGRQLPASLAGRAVVVWVVRHGERADEKSGPELLARQRSVEARLMEQVVAIQTSNLGAKDVYKCHHMDPPLTHHGLEQADSAGKILACKRVHVDTIFASPTLRASQTALGVAASLLDQGSQARMALQRVTGLSRCTSTSGSFMAAEHLNVLVGDNRMDILDLVDTDETFIDSAERLATRACTSAGEEQSTRRPELVLVTHREGIWELLAAAGLKATPYMPPYASICQLMFVPPVQRTTIAKSVEVNPVAEDTSGTGWYIAPAGFDVGYTLDPGNNQPPWKCRNCSGTESTSFHRIWSAGPSSVCCEVCGQKRPWHCRTCNDDLIASASS